MFLSHLCLTKHMAHSALPPKLLTPTLQFDHVKMKKIFVFYFCQQPYDLKTKGTMG